MCRGLKRPEPGSKGENPKLPYDKKSYEEHFPLLGQGSRARVGQTKPGPAASSSTSAVAKASSQEVPEPSTPSTSAVAKTNGQKVVKRKAPPAGQVPNEEPKAKRKPQRATLTKPAVKTSNRFSVLKDGVPSDDEEAMPPKKQAKTAAQRKQESRANQSKLAKKAEKAKNAARMATPAEKAKNAARMATPAAKAANAKAKSATRAGQKAKKAGSYLNAAKLPENYPNVDPEELEIEPVRVGRFNKVCTCCGAYMLACETHTGQLGLPHEPGMATFSLCCNNGHSQIEPLQEPPDLLKGLLAGVPASVELELAYQKECTKRMPHLCYSTDEKRYFELDKVENSQFYYRYTGPESQFFDSHTGKYKRENGLDHPYARYTVSYLEQKAAYRAKCLEQQCSVCQAVTKMGGRACHDCAVEEAARLTKLEAKKSGHLGILPEPLEESILPQCTGHGVEDACDRLPKRPNALCDLLKAERRMGSHFRANIRKYNNALSFASKGFTGKYFEFRNPNGPPCYKISGQMYHNMTNVLPTEGENPQFSQLYVYDEQHELDARMGHVDGLDPDILKRLQDMMHEVNPLVACYKHAAQVMRETPAVDLKVKIASKTNENNKRKFRAPVVDDVGLIDPQRPDNDPHNPRDVILYKNQASNPDGHKTIRISTLHPWYDPTAYPVIHPYGELGFELGQKCHVGPADDADEPRAERKLNTNKFYRNRLMIRGHFNPLLKCGRLLQEYSCDNWSKIEGERLNWIRNNQSQLRAEVYDGLADALLTNEERSIGKEVRMPASFVTSNQWLYAHYLDSLAIARKYQKFTFFITNTCNPKGADTLAEIDSWNMFQPNDRPDVVDRVYKALMKVFHTDLEEIGVMGEHKAHVNVFEQQMRSLWHCHNSLLVKGIITEGEIDSWISAEIPDPEKDPRYHEVVVTQMLHGPCGAANPKSSCMVKNKDGQMACRFGFPKNFSEQTYLQPNGYPYYKRPNNGRVFTKNGFDFDNRWVVANNRYLLMRYQSHTNSEYIGGFGSLRYQFKYYIKGQDLVTAKVTQEANGADLDEVEEFVNARFITAHFAMWRLIEGPIVSRYPPVVRLAVHDKDKQFVTFKPGMAREKLANPPKTTLTAWFEYNKANHAKLENEEEEVDEVALETTYLDFPEKYVFNQGKKSWAPRKRQPAHENAVPCIGRLNAVMRSSDDRYYLRMLLHHQKGCKSFEDVRTVQGHNGDEPFATYKEAAQALGLLSDDNEIRYALNEAWHAGTNPAKIRSLFAIQLKHGEISGPLDILTEFQEELFGDMAHEMGEDHEGLENAKLIRLDDLLQDMGSSLSEFPELPQPDFSLVPVVETRAFTRERYDANEQSDKLVDMMPGLQDNPEQLAVFNSIKQALDEDTGKQIVLNAPGGYGKTFLFTCASTYARSQGMIVLCCASTGIAAWNLEGGRTAHSMFKIPIDANADSTSDIRAQTSEAEVIRQARLIIWDEIFNVHQHTVMVVERLLRDLMGNKEPWGGKVVLLGGDPRQTPPVVKRGKRGEAVAASFKSCPLYVDMEEVKLTRNMRVSDGDQAFCDWLLTIGEGTVSTDADDTIELPDELMAKDKMDLIESTFPKLEVNDEDELMTSGIFCPRNEDVWEINEICLNRLPGQSRTYLSYDRVEDQTNESTAPTELLNSRRPAGFPDHNLRLKVGAPVMLLRNLQAGLVNGTRMIVRSMHDKVIECEIMVGARKGERVFIPRIPMYDRSNEFPWTMIRTQFPIRVCFAMTIHKGQGQSMTKVGVYIGHDIFAHGQLYVAVSRSRSKLGLKIFVKGGGNVVKNIVYKEIL